MGVGGRVWSRDRWWVRLEDRQSEGTLLGRCGQALEVRKLGKSIRDRYGTLSSP